ncbi:MAG: hypothetical protein FWC57_04635, partial [Endomicrobia bacterium]|nr:hypothetical protein [Endomicrobiia bacterium]
MKASKLFLPLLLVFSYTLCWAQHAPSNKSKYSVLGESGEEIYGTFDEYSNQYQNVDAIEPSGAEISVSSPASDANYGAQLPVSVQQIAGQGALNYLEEDLLGKLKYTREGWQKKESALPEPSVSTAAAKQTQELPPGILTKLPFESELSLSGRKLVGIDYTSRSYDKPQDGLRNNTSNFKMNQELQMKILGKVGDRLSINVDYDDTVNKKDISLVYKGQPGEFVQQAAFGDITVTLPTTEFTGYSKELFGLKVDTQYKRLATNVFFSQTKGASEVKRFKGNYMLQRMTIADTSYIRFKYFSIQKPAAPQAIKSGSARVFIDYQNLNPALNISVTTNTVLQPLIPGAFSYRGNFVLLTAGQDYTIDYNTGVLAFKNILASNYAVAIDYQYADNSWLSSGGASPSAPLIIKDPNNTAGVTTELKTFYSLGNLKIQRDNGRGNFILALKDLNGNAAASIPNTSGPDSLVPLYPPVNGYQSNITVDFENGVFNLNPSTGTPLHDDLYTLNNHRYNFVTEYHYMIKILTLRPGIVPKSEKVVIDGAAMQQNADYIIDYDLGILTIVNDSKITENSVIDISYDYSMLGSSDSTLIGARSSLNLTNNISMGASLMYDFSAKGSVLPDIRSTPTSLMVAEGDVRITDLDIDALNLRVNAGAEYAVSSQNNNASGKAVIDSMDSSVYEDAANLIQENWFHSAAGNPAAKRNLWELNWRSYNVNIRDIDPDLELVSGQQQLVSEITYDVTTRSQAAFAQRISVSGLDFSKKLYIDVWIKDNGSTANFALDYATSINEDADGDGILDTEDKDGNGVLSPWEDTGQEYHNVDGSVSLIGARNGKLDTEDLNGNGLLDTYEDISGSYMLSSGTVLKNVNGWKQIRIPLNIDPSYDPARWQNVRMLRLRVVRNLGESGTIVI